MLPYIFDSADNGLAWFPEGLEQEFYIVQGIIALVSTMMLLWHMNKTWRVIEHLDQQLRYLTLLAFSILVTGASIELVNDMAPVNWRNLGSLAVAILLIVTMLVSIKAVVDRERR